MIFMWLSRRRMGLGHSTILKAVETPVPDSKSIPFRNMYEIISKKLVPLPLMTTLQKLITSELQCCCEGSR